MTDVSFYQRQAGLFQSTVPWVRALQQQGLTAWQTLEFPKRTDEDWRYTRVDGFLQHDFQPSDPAHPLTEPADFNAMVDIEHVSIIDGSIIGLEALRNRLPEGVIIGSLQEAIQQHPEKIRAYLNQGLEIQHGFHAQNAAMLGTGIFIYLPPHTQKKIALCIHHRQTQAERACYLRHVIIAEAGSELTLIEDYHGAENLPYFTNSVTELFVKEHAQVSHYKIQREGSRAFHVGYLVAEQAAQSRFQSHVLSLGALWSRSDVCCHLREPEAHCLLNGIYVPRAKQHMDHHTWVHHHAADCQSEQDYRGILTEQSHAVFNGQVHVAPYAQKTVAKQQNKNLLLSKHAEIDTKPQLDIAADDVICTHGATVGQLDPDALFYFATRGIDESSAIRFLIQAFTDDNLRRISSTELAAWMRGLLTQQFGPHDE